MSKAKTTTKTRLLGLLLIWVGLIVGPTQITGIAQTSGITTNMRVFASNPVGLACTATSVGLYGGVLYTCQSGVYAAAGGGSSFTSPVIITSTANPCFAVGPNGATNPTLAVNCSVASAVTGILVTPAAAGSGVTVGVTSSGTNENLILTPKGTGNVLFPTGSSTAPSIAFNGDSNTGFYNSSADRIQAVLGAAHHTLFWGNGLSVQTGQITVGGSINVGIVDAGTNILRVTNATTGAGQLLIGTSTDTADAQLSVYSQSATRPGLKLRALAGTADSQPAFETYDASGARVFYIQANGQFSSLLVNGGIATIGAGSGIALGQNATLLGEAAYALAQRSGTNAQTFRIYETYTDGSNYERLEINASATTNTIKPAAAGTGTASKIDYYLTPIVFMTSGTGSPEGAITAGIGSTYHRTDGGAGTSFYVKESGTGNTGWVAK